MNNSSIIKKYLIDEKYLFNEENNGKVIMLSGKWGTGKTYFWKNIIEPKLSVLKHNKKAYVYISLYGKEDIESIKNEILIKAYESVENESTTLNRSVSVFNKITGVVPAISFFGTKINMSSIESLFTIKKINSAKEFLLDGGIICFDDFERKSSKIDLNDLFGLIAQLSQDMKCKIVIILNSDVFEGRDATIFRNVKEKTVNKFLQFEPTTDELFDSIFNEKKYKNLFPYREEILQYIKITNELNARFYIQILDNCFEWLEKGYLSDYFKPLILITVFFLKHHFTLEYRQENSGVKIYTVIDYFLHKGFYEIAEFLTRTSKQLFLRDKPLSINETIQILMSHINKNKNKKSEDYLHRQNDEIEKHKNLIFDFINYIYFLKVDDIDKETYFKINDFVKSGILIKEN
jgi:hypothetical protein